MGQTYTFCAKQAFDEVACKAACGSVDGSCYRARLNSASSSSTAAAGATAALITSNAMALSFTDSDTTSITSASVAG